MTFSLCDWQWTKKHFHLEFVSRSLPSRVERGFPHKTRCVRSTRFSTSLIKTVEIARDTPVEIPQQLLHGCPHDDPKASLARDKAKKSEKTPKQESSQLQFAEIRRVEDMKNINTRSINAKEKSWKWHHSHIISSPLRTEILLWRVLEEVYSGLARSNFETSWNRSFAGTELGAHEREEFDW